MIWLIIYILGVVGVIFACGYINVNSEEIETIDMAIMATVWPFLVPMLFIVVIYELGKKIGARNGSAG